ncbi:MAG: DUF4189 domain-containing protein [Alphaproteobacteria bacterium]|nr:DUF4189 domain-containing protein [Alphaproteobacteria bacterium]
MSFSRVSLAALIFAISLLPAPAAHADDTQDSKWGAIAIDTKKAEKAPYYGVGGDDTEDAASETAMKNCKEAGGEQCKTIVTYEACGALAVDGKGTAGWGKAPTKKDAEMQALSGCKEDACQIVVSDCNTGN